MCFTFKKNNKQTKKPVNCFLQDDASAGIQSLQTSIEIKLCQNPSDGLYTETIKKIDIKIIKEKNHVKNLSVNHVKDPSTLH